MAEAGLASQRRTAVVRSGKSSWIVALCSATRRRVVVSSRSTSRRDTLRTAHPRSAARRGAGRVFRSWAESIACMSGTADFTSTTSRAPVPGGEGEDVDRPALTVHREGRLGENVPARVR